MSPIRELDFYNLGQTISRRLPLIDRIVERYAADAPFEGVTALFFQHQLGNQVAMVDALIRLGLAPERIHWVDIPYTSHARVRDALQDLGIPASGFRMCDDFRLLMPYAPYQRRRAIQAYRDLLELDPAHLLVLDDGAYFLEAASCFDARFRRCAIVEPDEPRIQEAGEERIDDRPIGRAAAHRRSAFDSEGNVGVSIHRCCCERLARTSSRDSSGAFAEGCALPCAGIRTHRELRRRVSGSGRNLRPRKRVRL